MTKTSTDTGDSPKDWTSLGVASRKVITNAVIERAMTQMGADIIARTGDGPHVQSILMTLAARIVKATMESPPAGECPTCWSDLTWTRFRETIFSNASPKGINGCTLTEDMAIPLLKEIVEVFTASIPPVAQKAAENGCSRDTLLASALAGHVVQIASIVVEQAGAHGMDAFTAVHHLYGVFQVTEAIVRDGISRGPGIGEVMGHA